MTTYTFTLEEKAKMGILETIEDCKFQRDSIIAIINENKCDVVLAMKQVAAIVTSSNYSEMDLTMEETVEKACKDSKRMTGKSVIDMGSINRENAMKNLPSSLR